ncbi:MAG: endonuclease/exonuclease/phosphatase family protein [Desulfosudaceae bacterium]
MTFLGHHGRMRLITLVLAVLLSAGPAFSATVKIATYNVENLFDAQNDGSEYPDYVPGGRAGWNRRLAVIKTAHTARVIAALAADVVALQEIESRRALDRLRKKLRADGRDYPYSALADTAETTVACALLSRFPLQQTEEISPGPGRRNILKAVVSVDEHPLVLFINHWKSRQGPESRRLVYARALKKEIDQLPPDADVVVLGDFNANYNEYETFRDKARLNDTGGITGINHVLGTVQEGRLVDESILIRRRDHRYLYNLWLELPPWQRWSHEYFGHRSSLDSIIVSGGLFDDHGISYLDNSFARFTADFLFRDGAIFRWQQADHGRGRHLGEGYSDHLPLVACFASGPFSDQPEPAAAGRRDKSASSPVAISRLYEIPAGRVNLGLKNCAVIYAHGNNAVIKQKSGRAIYVYQAADDLEPGGTYDLTVRQLYDHYGLREIKAVSDLTRRDGTVDPRDYFLDPAGLDLNDRRWQNEVISSLAGVYRDKALLHEGERIRLYFKDKHLRPAENTRLIITGARVGFHRTPELVIEKPGQVQVLSGGQP